MGTYCEPIRADHQESETGKMNSGWEIGRNHDQSNCYEQVYLTCMKTKLRAEVPCCDEDFRILRSMAVEICIRHNVWNWLEDRVLRRMIMITIMIKISGWEAAMDHVRSGKIRWHRWLIQVVQEAVSKRIIWTMIWNAAGAEHWVISWSRRRTTS